MTKSLLKGKFLNTVALGIKFTTHGLWKHIQTTLVIDWVHVDLALVCVCVCVLLILVHCFICLTLCQCNIDLITIVLR
jgi:hypothetical protein